MMLVGEQKKAPDCRGRFLVWIESLPLLLCGHLHCFYDFNAHKFNNCAALIAYCVRLFFVIFRLIIKAIAVVKIDFNFAIFVNVNGGNVVC